MSKTGPLINLLCMTPVYQVYRLGAVLARPAGRGRVRGQVPLPRRHQQPR